MKVEIRIPEIAEGVSAGTVVALSVALGDQVEVDQTLLELETDKAVVAIPTPVAGTISALRVAVGDVVSIGTVMALIEGAETAVSAADRDVQESPVAAQRASAETPFASLELKPAESPSPVLPEAVVSEAVVAFKPVPGEQQVAAAAPSVRRLARELGVDIHQVSGSGPRGRIAAEDVNAYVKKTLQAAGQSPAAKLSDQRPLPDFSRFGTFRRESLARVRELTGDAMAYAWSSIPMVTQYDKAVIDRVEEFRQAFNAGATAEIKLTMTAFLVKVCAAALRNFPEFNSALDTVARELILLDYINIGVAVDTSHGLLVPVIPAADGKGVESISAELNELAVRARERRLTPAEMEGGTFTLSNLGGVGGTAFTPIVYAPQVAILGVSTAEMQPLWNGEEFEPQLVMPLALTYDHRVIDGAAGARFLRWICRALENPLQLVMK